MNLSLCMIFRDEIDYLPKAIASVSPFCNELVLVNSGSSDGSGDWASAKAKDDKRIRYFERPWPGNFANQRNFAIEQATGDWILTLDADEQLKLTDPSVLQALLADDQTFAYQIEIQNFTNDFSEVGFRPSHDYPEASGYIPTYLHRLFRRDERIRYSGILHERIEPSLEKVGLKMSASPLQIHHFGKLKEVEKGTRESRLAFYEELGRAKIKENPWDPQAHWELGVVLQKQKKLDAAEAEFKKALDLSPKTSEFETYYLLSLYQQNAWPRILKYQPQSRHGEFYVALAKAESDTSALQNLLDFSDLFSQAPVLAFEIALRREARGEIAGLRVAAERSLGISGLVDFIEGSHLRKLQRFNDALPYLTKAVKAKLGLAFQEYLICLIKTEQMPRVIEFFRSLSLSEQRGLSEDSLKMIDLAHLSLGMGRDQITTLRNRFKNS